jgi:nucleosome binding factor SPN SPT16 subunit
LYYVLIIFQSDEDKTNFLKLIDALKRSKQGKALGVFSKDNYPGPFMDAWRAALKKEHFETVSFIFIMDQTHPTYVICFSPRL